MTPNNSRLYVWAIIVVTAIGVGATEGEVRDTAAAVEKLTGGGP